LRTLNGHIQRFVSKGSADPAGLAAVVRQVLGQRGQVETMPLADPDHRPQEAA
jgi:hypothetical protein